MRIKKNLDEAIYEKLIDSVLSGRWNSGEVLSVEGLCNQYEVSRTPVVQAVKRLTSEGLTEFLPNGKVRFPFFDDQQVRDVCFVRKLLENTAARLICERRVDVVSDDMIQCVEGCLALKQAKYDPTASQLDLKFHRLIVQGSRNTYLSDVYELVQKKFLAMNYLNRLGNNVMNEDAAKQHMDICQALKEFDYDRCVELINIHVDEAMDIIMENNAAIAAQQVGSIAL